MTDRIATTCGPEAVRPVQFGYFQATEAAGAITDEKTFAELALAHAGEDQLEPLRSPFVTTEKRANGALFTDPERHRGEDLVTLRRESPPATGLRRHLALSYEDLTRVHHPNVPAKTFSISDLLFQIFRAEPHPAGQLVVDGSRFNAVGVLRQHATKVRNDVAARWNRHGSSPLRS